MDIYLVKSPSAVWAARCKGPSLVEIALSFMSSLHRSSSESSTHKVNFARFVQRVPPGVCTAVWVVAFSQCARGDDGTIFFADGGLSAPKLSVRFATEQLFEELCASSLGWLLSSCGDGFVGIDSPSSTRSAAEDVEFPI